MQWPLERAEQHSAVGDEDEFRRRLRDLYDTLPARKSAEYESVVREIVDACDFDADAVPLLERLVRTLELVSDGSEKTITSYAEHALLAFACVDALRQNSSHGMWRTVSALCHHSGSLELLLADVCIAVARDINEFAERLVTLLMSVLTEAQEHGPAITLKHQQEQFQGLAKSWTEHPTLSTIWWGLRGAETFRLDTDGAAFRILSELDLGAFVNILSRFNEPYTVEFALTSSGAAIRFATWRCLLQESPIAFDQRGAWSGSPIVPLLLVMARNQLLFARNKMRPDTPEPQGIEIKQEVDELADAIVQAICSRPDSNPLFVRWAIWLTRQLIVSVSSAPNENPNEIRSNAYADSQLIDTIGKVSTRDVWNGQCPSDAEKWEPWCFRALQATYAYAGSCEMPGVSAFLEEWSLSPDDWYDSKGDMLRARAELITSLGEKHVPTYGAQLLALPIATSDRAFEHWLALWRHCSVLREIVEFDRDSQDGNRLHAKFDAGRLVILAFNIGLSMLDSASYGAASASARQALAENLYPSLVEATREMQYIDRINRDFWVGAVRQVAVRRLIWGAKPDSVKLPPERPAVFSNDTHPTFAEILQLYSNDTVELLNLLLAGLLNVPEPELRQHVDDASIDLPRQLSIARDLIRRDSRRYPITVDQLSKIDRLAS